MSSLAQSKMANTVVIAIVVSTAIVLTAAGLGRAVHNLQGALTMKPDIAVYLLLPDEGITDVTLLRQAETERDYLIETKEGSKMVRLILRDDEWTVRSLEPLRGADE